MCVWLASIARRFNFTRLAGLLRDKPDLGVAVIFYLIHLGGIVYFAIMPAVAGGRFARAFLNGALLGFLVEATNDTTNLATLKGYPAIIAVADIARGDLSYRQCGDGRLFCGAALCRLTSAYGLLQRLINAAKHRVPTRVAHLYFNAIAELHERRLWGAGRDRLDHALLSYA